MTHIWRRLHVLSSFCLFLLLSACGQNTASSPATTPTKPSLPATTPTRPPLSTPIPSHSTTATPAQAAPILTGPAQGTARSAILSPMNTGKPALVYLSQEKGSSVLHRYDPGTGSTSTILHTSANTIIGRANVSPDGEWVLLLSQMHDQLAIQLVRVDGQYLQTLYCTPAHMSIDKALLSPDQRTIIFNQINHDMSISTLFVLDMTTGKLQIELLPQQPNYPGIAQDQSHPSWLTTSSSSQRLNTPSTLPLPGEHFLIYIPLKWADNKSVYLDGIIRGSGPYVQELTLLRNITKDVASQQSRYSSTNW